MLYRIEDANDYISVRHVETDREVGAALERRVYIDGSAVDVCNTFNNAGEWLAVATSQLHSFPLQTAAMALADHEEQYDFPDLKCAEWNVHADRVERRLGSVIADTASAFARAFCEAAGSGLTDETRDQFAGSLAELASLCRIGHAGCFNATTRTHEPYFANPLSCRKRLNFSDAAEWYGMLELRTRHPDLSDAEQQKLVGWVLRWLSDLLAAAVPARAAGAQHRASIG
jgi:hypothetical protein